MNQLFFSEESDNFKNYVKISALLHLSLVITVALKSFVFSSQTIVIPPSVRVDVVDLPDKVAEKAATPAPPKEKPAPKPAPKEKKEDLAKKTKEDQKKALEKLSAMNAIDKIRNEVRQEESKEPPAPKSFKGNIISSGNNFTGIARLRVNDYLELLTSRVRDHWVLPQWLSDANLKASVLMAVDARGNLIRREIYATSGNTVFDSSCLAAIENAAPFAPPPSEVEEAQILIRFPFE